MAALFDATSGGGGGSGGGSKTYTVTNYWIRGGHYREPHARNGKDCGQLIAATNRDLETMVNEQKIRMDLYYRLNIFPIRVSPLRERPEDIPLLVNHFVQQFSRRMGKGIDIIPSETMTTLIRYPWPGNVRELQNVIERAVIICTGPVFRLPTEGLHLRAEQPPVGNHCNGNLRAALNQAERQEIIAALEKTIGRIGGSDGAAALLGMNPSTLRSRMQKLGISTSRSVMYG